MEGGYLNNTVDMPDASQSLQIQILSNEEGDPSNITITNENANNISMEDAANISVEDAGTIPVEDAGNISVEGAGNIPVEDSNNVPSEDAGNIFVEDASNIPEKDTGNIPETDAFNLLEVDAGDVSKEDASNMLEVGADVEDASHLEELKPLETNDAGSAQVDENVDGDLDSQLLQALVSESDAGAEVQKWPGWPGENVFRMLIPVQKVGGIIGRKGELIKKLSEDTKARIKILNGPPGSAERAVLVSAKEDPDVSVPPAMEGLMRLHQRLINGESDSTDATALAGVTVTTRFLVADTQAGSVIGKQGATIKSIQDSSGCNIRVLGAEHLPIFALKDDSIIEIQGEPSGVHKAVELIASHLRKFLVDRSIVGVFETQMQAPKIQPNHNIPPPQQSWGNPQGFGVNPFDGPGPGFRPNHHPSQQYDNYYPPPEVFPPEKQPRGGVPFYGRGEAPIGSHQLNVQPQQSVVSKVTQHMQIPLSYADSLIGTSGANISYIRRSSGAAIAIQETRGVPGEMTVEMSGSASQIQTAQQLIQNFIAEAAASSVQQQNPTSGASASQGYNNAYPGPTTTYAPPQSDAAPAAHAGYAPPGTDYGSVYANNYGY